MEETSELYEEYELDSVPSTEKVFSWETPDKYEVISFIKSSPQRQKILEMLLREPMTTKEITQRLGEKQQTAYYHINCLVKGEKLSSDREDADSYPAMVESKTPYRQSMNLWGLTEDGYYTAKWLEMD